MRFGFHISIAQGFSRVVEKAKCETIQLFSRNPRGWKYNDLEPNEVEQFKTKLASSNISPCFSPPLSSQSYISFKGLLAKSIYSFCEDLCSAKARV